MTNRWGIAVGLLSVAALATTWKVVQSQHSDQGRVLGARDNLLFTTIKEHPAIAPQPSLTEEAITPYAQSAVVIDGGSGKVLIEKNAHDPVAIASTTKVMSAVVLLKSGKDLNEPATISQAAATQIGSIMGIQEGETLTLKDLLIGALLVSGNDAIYAIAEHLEGVDSFVNTMNTMAEEIGLQDTHFLDPAGLDDAGHSSAFDLAMLFRYALTFDQFRTIISTADSTVVSVEGISHHLQNSNRLIQLDEGLYLPEAIGGKTGFTPDAGHTLVTAAQRNNHLLVTTVLHTEEESNPASAREANRLLSWTFDHTTWSH